MSTLSALKQKAKKKATTKKAKVSAWFFKTGPGEYGEGDVFIGLMTPKQHQLANKYKDLSAADITRLLNDKIHEYRAIALFIMIEQYQTGDSTKKKKVIDLYLKNISRVNNWDLVDQSAPKLLGHYLYGKNRSLLYKLARSKNLWKERISVLSTFYFIRQKDYADTLKLAKFFLTHKHDLMHKAVGWMLREIGNRNKKVEIAFLKKHYKNMPRTMLRYAIEKFPKTERIKYLKGLI